MRRPDPNFWAKQRVFLTGHTGFKGAWATLWLQHMGATVHGYALAPSTTPSLYDAAGVGTSTAGDIANICDGRAIMDAMMAFEPTVLIHMAAQPLVRLSYDAPIETFHTNVVGTANVLEAARRTPSLRALVAITTDKCYENMEQIWPYREIDRLGGKDPYSASKACAELVSISYHWSYFSKTENLGTATVRAGNVIGGGDWSKDRLVPDMAQAFAEGRPGIIRRPNGVRPWQHVLEPVAGYLLAAEHIYGKRQDLPQSWNFGPNAEGNVTVGEVVKTFSECWGGDARVEIRPDPDAPHEATLLSLDSTKAMKELGWQPRFSLPQSLAMTADWYRTFYQGGDVRSLSLAQIDSYNS